MLMLLKQIQFLDNLQEQNVLVIETDTILDNLQEQNVPVIETYTILDNLQEQNPQTSFVIDKPFKCDKCKIGFGRKYNLNVTPQEQL